MQLLRDGLVIKELIKHQAKLKKDKLFNRLTALAQ